MQELLKINYGNDKQTISGRELHEFLGIETQYTKWFERMSEYGFAESEDYVAVIQKRLTAQGNETTFTDHNLTIDMAKEISMLQRTEKGKQARQYFLDLEKKWNSPEFVMARAIKMAGQQIEKLQLNLSQTTILLIESEKREKELIPAAEFGNAVGNSKGSILVRDYVKILAKDGIKIGQDQFFEWLRANKYIYKIKGYKSQWSATKSSIDLGVLEMIERPFSSNESGDFIAYTVKITGHGQRYFYKQLKKSTFKKEVVNC